MIKQFILTLSLLATWLLEILIEHWFIHLLFIASWIFVFYYLIKFFTGRNNGSKSKHQKSSVKRD